MKKITAFSILFAFMLASCKKSIDSAPASEDLAPLSLEFDNIVGSQNLQLGTGVYTNAAGENYSIDLLQYYVTNIQVSKADGTTYTVNQDSSYFLIMENTPSSRFARVKVPEGEYSKVSFLIGVDSLRSISDISKRTGVLDPSGGMDAMYWGWNSGYIFLKMEGTSPAAPLDPTGVRKFRYHIGGFGGYTAPTINNLKKITLDLTAGGIAKVRKDKSSNVHIMVDISKVLSNTTNVSIATNSTVMFSDYSVNIANNYANMFRHDHTEN